MIAEIKEMQRKKACFIALVITILAVVILVVILMPGLARGSMFGGINSITPDSRVTVRRIGNVQIDPDRFPHIIQQRTSTFHLSVEQVAALRAFLREQWYSTASRMSRSAGIGEFRYEITVDNGGDVTRFTIHQSGYISRDGRRLLVMRNDDWEAELTGILDMPWRVIIP